MKTENLSTLKIYKLTKEQYESRVASGDIDEHAIYLTPDEKIDLSPYATKEELNTKANSEHNHDSEYDTKGSANTALDSAKSYTDTKTSGLASTSSVDTKISTHNTAIDSHNDIRDLVSGLTIRLNTLADSDDVTLDQMSEIVTYIKSNKDLIDGVTTSKVNVADIIDNLTTNVSNKPLSAAQGVVIQNLINTLQTEIDNKANSVHEHSWNDLNDRPFYETTIDGTTEVTTLDEKYIPDTIARKSYVDEHDVLIFKVTYNSEEKKNYLVDVTFEELDAYALQNRMVALSNDDLRLYQYTRRSVSNGVTKLYYSQMYGGSHYYLLLDSDGNVYSYVSNLMTSGNPTGTGILSINRKANTTKGKYSATIGYNSIAAGDYSYAEGYYANAYGNYSHAEGWKTIASGSCQHAQGKYNIEDANDAYAHIVGNGSSDSACSNAHTLDWSGNAWFAGDVYVGSTSGTNKDEGSSKLATLADINTAIEQKPSVQFITWGADD